MGAKLVVKTLDGLAENSITEQPQPQVAEPKNAFKIFKKTREFIGIKKRLRFIISSEECRLILIFYQFENRSRNKGFEDLCRNFWSFRTSENGWNFRISKIFFGNLYQRWLLSANRSSVRRKKTNECERFLKRISQFEI